MKYVCTDCGWEYDEIAGYPEGGIAPGTPWSEMPDSPRTAFPPCEFIDNFNSRGKSPVRI